LEIVGKILLKTNVIGKGTDKMAIIVNLDVMLAKRKMSSGELASKIGLTQANLSILKTGKAKAVRFSTLSAICKELNCQPGDILEFIDEGDEDCE
jgi:putative transcriptional regulator